MANLSLLFGVSLRILETLIRIEPPFAFHLRVDGLIGNGGNFVRKYAKK